MLLDKKVINAQNVTSESSLEKVLVDADLL